MNDAQFWTDADGTAHERCQLFFVGTGESIYFDPGAHPQMGWPRGGWAFFCPHCIEVWERIVMIDSRGQKRSSAVLSVACAKHSDFWEVPGSVLTGATEELLAILPPAMLKREFDVHLQYAIKEIESGSGSHDSTKAGSSPPDAELNRRQGTA